MSPYLGLVLTIHVIKSQIHLVRQSLHLKIAKRTFKRNIVYRKGKSKCKECWFTKLKTHFRTVSSQTQSTYRGRVQIGGVYLTSQLEHTPQLCT